MAKKQRTGLIITLLLFYGFLLFIDLGANFLAFFIPAFGAIAETLTEVLIEGASLIIVLFIVLIKRD